MRSTIWGHDRQTTQICSLNYPWEMKGWTEKCMSAHLHTSAQMFPVMFTSWEQPLLSVLTPIEWISHRRLSPSVATNTGCPSRHVDTHCNHFCLSAFPFLLCNQKPLHQTHTHTLRNLYQQGLKRSTIWCGKGLKEIEHHPNACHTRNIWWLLTSAAWISSWHLANWAHPIQFRNYLIYHDCSNMPHWQRLGTKIDWTAQMRSKYLKGKCASAG